MVTQNPSPSPAVSPSATTPSGVQVLESDPVLTWLRTTHRPASSRALMRAVAGGIVMTLSKAKRAERAAGRTIFMSCFVRPGMTLGTTLCRSIYASVLREMRSARRNRRLRDLHRLAGSYAELEHLGVPKPVCDRARRDGESMAARVENIILGDAETLLEEDLDLEYSPEQFLLDPLNNTWWMQLANGEWVGPMSNAGVMNRLNQLGLPEKQAKAFLARTRHFDTREPIFDVHDDLVGRGGRIIFNSYRPSTVRPEPGPWPDIYKVVLSVCDGDVAFANFFLDWLALPLQALYLRGTPQLNRTAVVLQGREGSGKNTLFEVMKAQYGARNSEALSRNGRGVLTRSRPASPSVVGRIE